AHRVRVVELEDEGDLHRVVAGDGLEEAEGRGVRVATGLDRELHVVVRVVPLRVRREGTGRAVLETLVHREDDQLSGPGERAGVEQPGQIGLHARAVGRIPGQDLLHAVSQAHGVLRNSDVDREAGVTRSGGRLSRLGSPAGNSGPTVRT